MTSRVAVIGAGSWGTAACGLAAANAGEVRLWCHTASTAAAIRETGRNPRYLTDYDLPGNVHASSDHAWCVEGARVVILALPSTHLRGVCRQLAPHVVPDAGVLVLTKGIEPGTGMLMNEVAADELGGIERTAALSGPNHAEEVCRQIPSAAVVASPTPELSRALQRLMMGERFRVYTSSDVRGVEVCGAVKNVIAIACGACVGLGAGDNTVALLMTRGIAEIGRMVRALGGDPMTCMGLAGMGDLVATCTSEHSRNRRFGEAFVRGTSLAEFEERTHMVVEGAYAVRSVRELAERCGVELPICDAVWSVLSQGSTVERMTELLMARMAREEFYGMEADANPSHPAETAAASTTKKGTTC